MTMQDPFSFRDNDTQRRMDWNSLISTLRNHPADTEYQIRKFVHRFNAHGFTVVVDENERRVGIRGPDGNGWWLFTDWRGK